MSVNKFGRQVVSVLLAMMLVVASIMSIGTVHAKEAATEWKKTTGALTAILVLTDKPKLYAKAWTKAKSKLPSGMIATTIKKSKIVVAMVFFKGCAGDKKRRCDAEIVYTVYKPSGKLYAKREGLSLWKREVVKSGLMLSAANLALSFDAKDPVGKYKIIVKIKDNISKKKLTLTRFITVSG